MSSLAQFDSAAAAFLAVVRQIRPDQLDQPGLGVWDVRSLVGHTARAILTVENYLQADEAESVAIPTAEAYYSTLFEQYTNHDAIAERGVEAGQWLGEDPTATISAAISRAGALIAAQPHGRLVSIGGLGIPLDEYLRTRVFELVVHTIDIAHATGIPHSLPTDTVTDTLILATKTAYAKGFGEAVLLALTGRGALGPEFSVVA